MRRLGKLSAIGATVITVVLTACDSTEPDTRLLVVTPEAVTVVPQGTAKLSAGLREADGTLTPPENVVWTSSDSLKATVTATGLVRGVAVGRAVVTATVNGKTSTAAIDVVDGGVARAQGGGFVAAGGVVSLSVVSGAVPVDTNIIVAPDLAAAVTNSRIVSGTTFTLSPGTLIFSQPATLSLRYSAAAVPSGASADELRIFRFTGGTWTQVTGSAAVPASSTVTAPITSLGTYAVFAPIAVTRVSLSQSVVSVREGGTTTLTATAFDASNNVVTGRPVAWTTSDATIATVDAVGVVRGIRIGQVDITATIGGQRATARVTVQPAVGSVTVALGANALLLGATTQATATVRDVAGNILTDRTVIWTSSNSGIASVSSTGFVIAVGAGTATITGTADGVAGSATITVTAQAPVATVTVTLPRSLIGVAEVTQAIVTLRDASGNVLSGRVVDWTSSDPNVATVTSTGVVTAIGVGQAFITAASEGRSGSATLTVTATPPVPIASVTIIMASSIRVGTSQQAQAVLRDANGNQLSGRSITWTSSNTNVATISPNGPETAVFTGVSVGTTVITATSEGVSGNVSLTVTATSPPAIRRESPPPPK